MSDPIRSMYDSIASTYNDVVDAEIGQSVYTEALGRLAAGVSGVAGPVVDVACGTVRLMRLHAADARVGLDAFDFSDPDAVPSLMLSERRKAKDYVLDASAETLAKAIAIPCMAALDPDADDLPLSQSVGEVPRRFDCMMLDAVIRYGAE